MATTEHHGRRRQKHSHNGEQNTVSIDRLSDLPDSILCHILSFLRTKDSVRTSILGQRWRFLWAYVPNLVFRNENPEIINSVLLLRRVQSINIFRLYCHFNCSAYQLNTWISFAVLRNVQELDLNFRFEDTLPRCLFTCKTLVHLSLHSWCVISTCGTVCLPRLKYLYLTNVEFEPDESLPHLLSGCPVLEELKIKLSSDMVYCNVSSTTIKRLVLNFLIENCDGRSKRLEINTPALEYLRINNSPFEHIKCGALTSLIEADVSFYNEEEKRDYYLYSRSLLEFFDRLCNVNCLTLDLSDCAAMIFDSVFSTWTTSFRNLTELELTADCRFLSKFLELADNLEILRTKFWEVKEGWTEPPQQVPTCLLSHLRIIELVDIEGKKHEFEYIGYLLRNAKVLKRMEIGYPAYLVSDEKINALKKISCFQRGSATCEVVFVQGRSVAA